MFSLPLSLHHVKISVSKSDLRVFGVEGRDRRQLLSVVSYYHCSPLIK